ncbi:RpiB/LacA/LacB family sugar-phosphate isomerase, partial [Dickeya dadantii]|nr:RpiB/LacA/LacB family sugar-phosphate isomerase [Dickeya dadantii]
MLSIAIGADSAAIDLKNTITDYLQQKGLTVTDYSYDPTGENPIYPDVAYTLAHAIKDGKHQRGILLCGTGIGMSIVANKVNGIRAAQCHDT